MREIKFRAWDSEKIIYGVDISNNGTVIQSGYEYPSWVIMQFTGLTDKNGKEVYSDDLMKDDEGRIFRIYHVNGGFVIKAYYWFRGTKDLSISDELIFESLTNPQNKSWVCQCQVVGNIYENPELLN